MAVRGENSLHFATGVDNSGLASGIHEAVGMVGGMADAIMAINPFAALGGLAIAAFGTISKAALDLARDYEQAMKEVQTISQAVQENFEGMAEAVAEISKVSTDSPVELANAFYQIVSAGYDGAAGLRLLEVSAKAATAGVTTTKVAADGLTTVLNAFNKEAEEAEDVADKLFTTVRLGKTNFKELAGELSDVAPLAAAMGFSLEEVLAAVATLTKQGVPTAQAMTQIRAALEGVGRELGDGAAQAMTLQNAFKVLADRAGGSQTELREMVGTGTAVSAILALTGENAKSAAEDLEAYSNTLNATNDAAAIMGETNVDQWEILGNRVKALVSDWGNQLLDISSGIASYFNDMLDPAEKLEETFNKQRVAIKLMQQELELANEGSEEWNNIRDEIYDNYPAFVAEIDKETASTRELLSVLDRVNESYRERYKLALRAQEVETIEKNISQLEFDIENSKDQFNQLLAELEVLAENQEIDLNLNFDSAATDAQKLKLVERELSKIKKQIVEVEDGRRLTASTFASETVQNLKLALKQQEEYNRELRQEKNLLDDVLDRQRRIRVAALENEDARRQIINDISQITNLRDLQEWFEYMNEGFADVDAALGQQMKTIQTLKEIRSIDEEDISKLEQYYDSEIQLIRRAAEERRRQINTTFEGGPGGDDAGETELERFKEMLKEKQEAYEAYQAWKNAKDEESAREAFEYYELQKETFEAYLEDLLEKTEDYKKREAIILLLETKEEVNTLATEEFIKGWYDKMQEFLQPLQVGVEVDTTNAKQELEKLIAVWKGAKTQTQDAVKIAAIDKHIEYLNRALEVATEMDKSLQEVFDRINEQDPPDLDFMTEFYAMVGEKGNLTFNMDFLDNLKQELDKLADEPIQLTMAFNTNDQMSVEQMEEMVSMWQQRWREAKGDEQRALAAFHRDYWQQMVDSTREGIAGVEEAYQGMTQQLSNQSRKYLEKYLEVWEKILETATDPAVIALATRNVEAAKKAIAGDTASTLDAISGSLKDASRMFRTFGNDVLADVLDKLSGVASGVSDIVTGITAGGPLGWLQAAGGVMNAIGSLFGGGSNEPEKTRYEKTLEKLESSIRKLSAEIEVAFGTDKIKKSVEQLEDYRKKIENIKKEIALMEILRDGDIFMRLTFDAKGGQQALADLEADLAEMIADHGSALEDLGELYTATTADSIADSIVEGFKSGKKTAEDFASDFGDMMKNALLQAFKVRYLEAEINKFYSAFQDAGEDQQYTETEINALRELYEKMLEGAKSDIDAINDILGETGIGRLGEDRNRPGGLSGAIQGVTETTANILEGYINAMRIDLRASIGISTQIAENTAQTAANTSRANELLLSMDGRLTTIESAMNNANAQG